MCWPSSLPHAIPEISWGKNQQEYTLLAMAERHFVSNYSFKIGVTNPSDRRGQMWLFSWWPTDAMAFESCSVERRTRGKHRKNLLLRTGTRQSEVRVDHLGRNWGKEVGKEPGSRQRKYIDGVQQLKGWDLDSRSSRGQFVTWRGAGREPGQEAEQE